MNYKNGKQNPVFVGNNKNAWCNKIKDFEKIPEQLNNWIIQI